MADFEDQHSAASTNVTDQVGPNMGQLPHTGRDQSPPVGKGGEAFTGQPKALGQLLGGVWLVEGNVALDVVKVAPGARRPYYLNHDLGGGTRLPVPQVLSQAATSS